MNNKNEKTHKKPSIGIRAINVCDGVTVSKNDYNFKSIIEMIKQAEWVVTCWDTPADKRPQSIIEQLIDNYFLPLRWTKNSVINSESL